MPTSASTLDKIIKLRTLAAEGSGATEAEAESANRMALRLIEKYEITEEQISQRKAELDRPRLTLEWWRNFVFVPTRADVARDHGIDQYKFRKWLRRHHVDWDTVARDKERIEEVVRAFKEGRPL